MAVSKLVGINYTLTVLTYMGALGLGLIDYPLWAQMLLGLVAALALTTNILAWQKRPPRSRNTRSRGLQTVSFVLNILLRLACLLAVYYLLNGG